MLNACIYNTGNLQSSGCHMKGWAGLDPCSIPAAHVLHADHAEPGLSQLLHDFRPPSRPHAVDMACLPSDPDGLRDPG